MSKKRNCHFQDESFKIVDKAHKERGYKSFNLALNVIIQEWEMLKKVRDQKIAEILKDINYLGIQPYELFHEKK